MQALILAAGYGTRLGSATLNTAKPLIEVAGKPMIGHLTDAIDRVEEVHCIHVVTNGRFYPDFVQWQQQAIVTKPIDIVNDGTQCNEERLGAIGDILLAVERQGIDEDLLVVGGDNLFQFELGGFVRFALARGTAVAVYRLPSRELARRFGNVELDAQGRIRWFEEKPAEPRTDLIATCVYLIRRGHLPMLDAYRRAGAKMDAPGLFIRWLAQQTDVYGFVCEGLWFDIGDPTSLSDARRAFGSSGLSG